MPDHGFAIISTSRSLESASRLLDKVERFLRAVEVIGGRLPTQNACSQAVRWSLGPKVADYLRGNPKEICVYIGEPTSFFDGTAVVVNDATFILETVDADPSYLREILESVLGTSLAVHPFRV